MPSEIDFYANWTLTHLGIGDVSVITLKLDVTKHYPDELVNRVEVCGGYGDEWISAHNFSALEIDWLTCRPDEISVNLVGEVDEENLSVVHYMVEIVNSGAATRVATVTDSLPAGMELLESMAPFASYDGRVVVWNLFEISPSETKTIEFSVLAPGAGRFKTPSRSIRGLRSIGPISPSVTSAPQTSLLRGPSGRSLSW